MLVGDLLDKRQKWCRRAGAKDKDGNVCDPTDEHAVKFCLVGAIYKCYDHPLPVLQKVKEELGLEFITTWNDYPSRTFVEVKSLIERLGI